jgi:hypothetical protein
VALLRRLATATFAEARALLALLARICPVNPVSSSCSSESDMEFSFSDGSENASAPGDPSFAECEIDGALDMFAEPVERNEQTRWTELCETLASIEYGLQRELRSLDARLAPTTGALSDSDRFAQLIAALDDTQCSVGQGLYATLVAVYGAYLPDIDVSTVAPGYESSLERALMVRRGLADFSREVQVANSRLQRDGTANERADALRQICTLLTAFVETTVFRAMRPADRWEIAQFDRALVTAELPAARNTCEGFAKFVESLSAINHREVLVLHDQKTGRELRETLSSSAQLISVSLRAAVEMARRGMVLAEQRYGKNAHNDELIRALREVSPSLTTESEVRTVLEMLELLLE